MVKDEKKEVKYRLAKQWVKNRPWHRFDIEVYRLEKVGDGHRTKVRVRLQYHRLTDGTWITVREHTGYSVKRSMVKIIEQLQGRELTIADVEVRPI